MVCDKLRDTSTLQIKFNSELIKEWMWQVHHDTSTSQLRVKVLSRPLE